MGSALIMKFGDAFIGVTKLGLDTSPFIYFVERHPTFLDIVREIIHSIDTGTISGYSSVVTLIEVLIQPKRAGNTTLEIEYRDLLLHSRNFTLLPINTAIAELAADLRARYALRIPDALQIAASLSAGCEAFLTNDAALQRVTELRVLILNDLEL